MNFFGKAKLVLRAANIVKDHAGTILHSAGGNAELLTQDLGDALRRQKKIIQDKDMSVLETAYEVLPVFAEVKVLTMLVSRNLELDTAGKSSGDVWEEIVKKTEARNSQAAAEIKKALTWTRNFYALPEVQDVINATPVAIEGPQGLTDIFGMAKTAVQGIKRGAQEVSKLQEIIQKAKAAPEVIRKPRKPKNDKPKA